MNSTKLVPNFEFLSKSIHPNPSFNPGFNPGLNHGGGFLNLTLPTKDGHLEFSP